MKNIKNVKTLVDKKLKKIRNEISSYRNFDPEKVTEIEVNKFILDNKEVDRIMVVLRATGCSYYKSGYGCSMCAHLNGTTNKPITAKQYIQQWNNVVSGESIDKQYKNGFDLNKYKIICLYNLGSLLNPKEVPVKAVKEIFRSISKLSGVKKIIIESRAEYVKPKILRIIRNEYSGVVEVGLGLESSNMIIRELCHHKNMPDLRVFNKAIKTLHKFNFKVLAYVNQKPVFLTEKEAIDDAIKTSIYAFKKGVDAVSIEPTSLQNHTLTDYLYNLGLYSVPWLWSVREVAKNIYERIGESKLDLRIGGYFDEEILSGSQGSAPGVERNEIFPYKTSGNCSHCSKKVIEDIKKFNKDQKLTTLYKTKGCKHCYSLWKSLINVKDSRSIMTRITDLLENEN